MHIHATAMREGSLSAVTGKKTRSRTTHTCAGTTLKTSGLLQIPIFLATMQTTLTARKCSQVAKYTVWCVYTLMPVDTQAQLTRSFMCRNLHVQHVSHMCRALKQCSLAKTEIGEQFIISGQSARFCLA